MWRFFAIWCIITGTRAGLKQSYHQTTFVPDNDCSIQNSPDENGNVDTGMDSEDHFGTFLERGELESLYRIKNTLNSENWGEWYNDYNKALATACKEDLNHTDYLRGPGEITSSWILETIDSIGNTELYISPLGMALNSSVNKQVISWLKNNTEVLDPEVSLYLNNSKNIADMMAIIHAHYPPEMAESVTVFAKTEKLQYSNKVRNTPDGNFTLQGVWNMKRKDQNGVSYHKNVTMNTNSYLEVGCREHVVQCAVYWYSKKTNNTNYEKWKKLVSRTLEKEETVRNTIKKHIEEARKMAKKPIYVNSLGSHVVETMCVTKLPVATEWIDWMSKGDIGWDTITEGETCMTDWLALGAIQICDYPDPLFGQKGPTFYDLITYNLTSASRSEFARFLKHHINTNTILDNVHNLVPIKFVSVTNLDVSAEPLKVYQINITIKRHKFTHFRGYPQKYTENQFRELTLLGDTFHQGYLTNLTFRNEDTYKECDILGQKSLMGHAWTWEGFRRSIHDRVTRFQNVTTFNCTPAEDLALCYMWTHQQSHIKLPVNSTKRGFTRTDCLVNIPGLQNSAELTGTSNWDDILLVTCPPKKNMKRVRRQIIGPQHTIDSVKCIHEHILDVSEVENHCVQMYGSDTRRKREITPEADQQDEAENIEAVVGRLIRKSYLDKDKDTAYRILNKPDTKNTFPYSVSISDISQALEVLIQDVLNDVKTIYQGNVTNFNNEFLKNVKKRTEKKAEAWEVIRKEYAAGRPIAGIVQQTPMGLLLSVDSGLAQAKAAVDEADELGWYSATWNGERTNRVKSAIMNRINKESASAPVSSQCKSGTSGACDIQPSERRTRHNTIQEPIHSDANVAVAEIGGHAISARAAAEIYQNDPTSNPVTGTSNIAPVGVLPGGEAMSGIGYGFFPAVPIWPLTRTHDTSQREMRARNNPPRRVVKQKPPTANMVDRSNNMNNLNDWVEQNNMLYDGATPNIATRHSMRSRIDPSTGTSRIQDLLRSQSISGGVPPSMTRTLPPIPQDIDAYSGYASVYGGSTQRRPSFAGSMTDSDGYQVLPDRKTSVPNRGSDNNDIYSLAGPDNTPSPIRSGAGENTRFRQFDESRHADELDAWRGRQSSRPSSGSERGSVSRRSSIAGSDMLGSSNPLISQNALSRYDQFKKRVRDIGKNVGKTKEQLQKGAQKIQSKAKSGTKWLKNKISKRVRGQSASGTMDYGISASMFYSYQKVNDDLKNGRYDHLPKDQAITLLVLDSMTSISTAMMVMGPKGAAAGAVINTMATGFTLGMHIYKILSDDPVQPDPLKEKYSDYAQYMNGVDAGVRTCVLSDTMMKIHLGYRGFLNPSEDKHLIANVPISKIEVAWHPVIAFDAEVRVTCPEGQLRMDEGNINPHIMLVSQTASRQKTWLLSGLGSIVNMYQTVKMGCSDDYDLHITSTKIDLTRVTLIKRAGPGEPVWTKSMSSDICDQFPFKKFYVMVPGCDFDPSMHGMSYATCGALFRSSAWDKSKSRWSIVNPFGSTHSNKKLFTFKTRDFRQKYPLTPNTDPVDKILCGGYHKHYCKFPDILPTVDVSKCGQQTRYFRIEIGIQSDMQLGYMGGVLIACQPDAVPNYVSSQKENIHVQALNRMQNAKVFTPLDYGVLMYIWCQHIESPHFKSDVIEVEAVKPTQGVMLDNDADGKHFADIGLKLLPRVLQNGPDDKYNTRLNYPNYNKFTNRVTYKKEPTKSYNVETFIEGNPEAHIPGYWPSTSEIRLSAKFLEHAMGDVPEILWTNLKRGWKTFSGMWAYMSACRETPNGIRINPIRAYNWIWAKQKFDQQKTVASKKHLYFEAMGAIDVSGSQVRVDSTQAKHIGRDIWQRKLETGKCEFYLDIEERSFVFKCGPYAIRKEWFEDGDQRAQFDHLCISVGTSNDACRETDVSVGTASSSRMETSSNPTWLYLDQGYSPPKTATWYYGFEKYQYPGVWCYGPGLYHWSTIKETNYIGRVAQTIAFQVNRDDLKFDPPPYNTGKDLEPGDEILTADQLREINNLKKAYSELLDIKHNPLYKAINEVPLGISDESKKIVHINIDAKDLVEMQRERDRQMTEKMNEIKIATENIVEKSILETAWYREKVLGKNSKCCNVKMFANYSIESVETDTQKNCGDENVWFLDGTPDSGQIIGPEGQMMALSDLKKSVTYDNGTWKWVACITNPKFTFNTLQEFEKVINKMIGESAIDVLDVMDMDTDIQMSNAMALSYIDKELEDINNAQQAAQLKQAKNWTLAICLCLLGAVVVGLLFYKKLRVALACWWCLLINWMVWKCSSYHLQKNTSSYQQWLTQADISYTTNKQSILRYYKTMTRKHHSVLKEIKTNEDEEHSQLLQPIRKTPEIVTDFDKKELMLKADETRQNIEFLKTTTRQHEELVHSMKDQIAQTHTAIETTKTLTQLVREIKAWHSTTPEIVSEQIKHDLKKDIEQQYVHKQELEEIVQELQKHRTCNCEGSESCGAPFCQNRFTSRRKEWLIRCDDLPK